MRVSRARRNTIAAIGAVVCAVLAATGCQPDDLVDSKPKADPTPVYRDADDLPESIAADGTTVLVGWPKAATNVHLWEDLRCPVCREFETKGTGPELLDLAVKGELRAEYTLASFLDDSLGGGGSKRAANALRAAVDRGRFTEYHRVLYAHQPEESEDGFTTERLLDLAGQVEGLRSPEFDRAVRTMKYRDFVRRSEKAFEDRRINGTPSVAVNGMRLGGPMAQQALFTPGGLRKIVQNAYAIPRPEGSKDAGS